MSSVNRMLASAELDRRAKVTIPATTYTAHRMANAMYRARREAKESTMRKKNKSACGPQTTH